MADRQLANRGAHGCSGTPRQRLVVLLGAGSTIHAGAPSTDDITEYLCVHEHDRLGNVIRGLCEQRGSLGFNFETIMAAMEALDGYTLDKRYPPVVGGEIGVFTTLRPGYEEFRKIVNVDSFSCLHRLLLSAITAFVIERTKACSVRNLSAFVSRLGERFDLTVVTLNYDDLIDRAGVWFDGFVPSPEGDQYEVFDHAAWRGRVASERAILLHLHGSVRFGRNPGLGGYVVKYHAAEEAQKSFRQSRGPVPRGPGRPVMISGDQKERNLNEFAAPLGYYYNAFVNAALDCPLWLIAGYGGRDTHVNRWIEQSAWAHQGYARIVHIDAGTDFPWLPAGPHVHWTGPTLGAWRGVQGNFPPTANVLDDIIAFLGGGDMIRPVSA